MKISIIIPVHNCEKFLDKCINSIINQTYKDFELLLVENGSTDNSEQICKKYSEIDDRIVLLKSNKNGPSAARNIGLKNASGEYVIFVDGDDYIEENTLEILVEKNNNYDLIIYGNYNDVYSENTYSINGTNVYKESIINNNNDMKLLFGELRKRFLANQVWNKFYKKSFLDEISVEFPEEINYSEDLIFNIKVYENVKKGIIIEIPLYHYVNHYGESICSSFDVNKYKYMKEVHCYIIKELSSWNPSLINDLNNNFVKLISIYINSLYNKNCNLKYSEKKYIVDNIIKDEVVVNTIGDMDVIGIRNKVIAELIKLKLSRMLLLMGKIARIIKAK